MRISDQKREVIKKWAEKLNEYLADLNIVLIMIGFILMTVGVAYDWVPVDSLSKVLSGKPFYILFFALGGLAFFLWWQIRMMNRQITKLLLKTGLKKEAKKQKSRRFWGSLGINIGAFVGSISGRNN